MESAYSNDELSRAFAKYVHHKSFSIILITQNLFFQGKTSRTITLKTHYIILYKGPRDSMQIMVLGRQIFPGNTKYFMECYQDATNHPIGFLLIDFKAKTPERFRLRSGLFSEHLGAVLRTSLNTSEMMWKMPDLLILITDLWLIWFFKRICVLD